MVLKRLRFVELIRVAVGLAALLLAPSAIWAQANVVPPLTDAEQQALELITERSVTGTIAFLASDEMGGRGTPSPEFQIASAYVAARFAAAGLQGGGPEGSFYQSTNVETTQLPGEGVVLSVGVPREHYGLLAAGKEPVNYEGDLKNADPNSDQPLAGAVVLPYDAAYSGRRGMIALMRAIGGLRERGAAAVILPVPADSELIGQARALKARPQMPGRGGPSLPVLLVRAEDEWAGHCALVIPPAVTANAEVRNVIGVLPGSDMELADEAIVFSAHLDHLGTRPGEADPIYNGADDDASGVTAVLSLADAFGALAQKPRRTVIFMTFWGEERGLLGSKHFAENPLWPLEKIVANINIEMIGRPEAGARNKVWMTGWERSDLGEGMVRAAERTGTLIFAHPKYSGDMLYRASDNWSLASKGVVAHSFSAGSLHEDYHQPTDDWQKLERDHMTAVIRGLFAGSLPLAAGDFTPQAKPEKK